MNCKATVLGNKSVFKGADGHPCERLAKLDGYCLQHHPYNMAKRETAAVAQHAANKAKVHKHCIEAFAALKSENDALRAIIEADRGVPADTLLKRLKEI